MATITICGETWYEATSDWKLDAAYYQWVDAVRAAQKLSKKLHQPCNAVRVDNGPGLAIYTVSTMYRPGSRHA